MWQGIGYKPQWRDELGTRPSRQMLDLHVSSRHSHHSSCALPSQSVAHTYVPCSRDNGDGERVPELPVCDPLL